MVKRQHWKHHELFDDCSPLLLKKFIKYHRENPELYDLFEQYALQASLKRVRFSIWMIANRVRWYTLVETSGSFKVSNDYLACYARLLTIKNPEIEGLFQFKAMKPDRVVPVE